MTARRSAYVAALIASASGGSCQVAVARSSGWTSDSALGALGVAALAQLAADLVLRELLELAVVVAQAPDHCGAIVGAGPSSTMNHTRKASPTTTAVTAKMRTSIPSRCSCPAARRRIRHAVERAQSASVTIRVPIMPAKAAAIPEAHGPVR